MLDKAAGGGGLGCIGTVGAFFAVFVFSLLVIGIKIAQFLVIVVAIFIILVILALTIYVVVECIKDWLKEKKADETESTDGELITASTEVENSGKEQMKLPATDTEKQDASADVAAPEK